MKTALHITSGDIAGSSLAKSGIPGEVFVWHDILYDGPRKPGWPDNETLTARAEFLEEFTGKGFSRQHVLDWALFPDTVKKIRHMKIPS